MKQNSKKAIVLTVILLSAVWMINLEAGGASKTINVPADYATISNAIGHASDGDTIAVASGVYQENLQLNKSITIIGQNPQTTILMGAGGLERGANPVVALNAKSAGIDGFTITSKPYNNTGFFATGIIINADYCTIKNNIINANYMGIFCSVQSYLQITDNTIVGNLKDGMRFYGGSYNTISGNSFVENAVSGLALQGYSNTVTNNTFQSNTRGLGLGSSYTVVFQNKFSNNKESGIWLAASKSIIAANQFSDNKWGVYITPQMGAPHQNSFYHNNFEDNAYAVYVNESAPVNYWDGGLRSGGNYWSDYSTKYLHAQENTTSGFSDTPYIVYEGAQDNYPLTQKYDISNSSAAPTAEPAPSVPSSGIVASWSFDSVDSNGVSLDSTGNNPAILGSVTAAKSYVPKTVAGKIANALSFDGQQYINVPASPSLEVNGEVTVDAWINVQSYKEIPYNNIIVQCLRTTDALPIRTLGFAINGEQPQNDSAPPVGALRGYVLTGNGNYNEIVTTKAVVPLNQWIHVVFTRSLTTGMHIFVDEQEEQVYVTAGVTNPQGSTVRPTETYIGHDAVCTIDQLTLSNLAESPTQPLWAQWWLWVILFAAIVGSGSVLYGIRRARAPKKPTIL